MLTDWQFGLNEFQYYDYDLREFEDEIHVEVSAWSPRMSSQVLFIYDPKEVN